MVCKNFPNSYCGTLNILIGDPWSIPTSIVFRLTLIISSLASALVWACVPVRSRVTCRAKRNASRKKKNWQNEIFTATNEIVAQGLGNGVHGCNPLPQRHHHVHHFFIAEAAVVCSSRHSLFLISPRSERLFLNPPERLFRHPIQFL